MYIKLPGRIAASGSGWIITDLLMCFDYIAEWTLIRRSEKWWFMQQTKGEWPWGYTHVPGCCRCKLHTWREREREKLGEFHNLIGIWWSDLITGLINTHFNSFSLKTKEVEIFYIFFRKRIMTEVVIWSFRAPEGVMLCVMPVETGNDDLVHMQHVLIEAHCREHKITNVKVCTSVSFKY